MTSDYGLVGNGELLAKVRADGALTEAYFPSIGFFRHIIQSQFGVYVREQKQCLWFCPPEFQVEQRYLEDTNVLQTSFLRPELRAQVVDFVHPGTSGIVRTLEVRNTSAEPLTLDLFHAEASSVADHTGAFGYNVVYYCRLGSQVVRYRGHPWDEAIEAQIVWLLSTTPPPDTYQCGESFKEDGEAVDAFVDVQDGRLHENRYASGDPTGVTSALMWHRRLGPGETLKISVLMVPGMSLFEAEDAAKPLREQTPDRLLSETVIYWRAWLEKGKRTLPNLPADGRMEELYLRSLLLLKLLQDRRYGSFIAAPTLDPDYRYCWPRDGVFEAWALDICGYHDEARHFYKWCQRTQMYDGLWYQNHYTDGRRHWAGIQVDQVGAVLWGIWQHYQETGDRRFLVDMWPTIRRAAEYIMARTDADAGLVFSEQDLWEETGGFFAYTNAACIAGLEAAAQAAREVGHEGDAARWRAAASALRREVHCQLAQDGYYVGERDPTQRFSLRSDYLLDISTVALAVPFRIVPASSPEMVRTVQRLQAAVDYPIEGVGRYASDLFMGGNPWSLSAIWMALYFVETGQIQEVYRQLNWCLKHAMLHDFMPEQSHKDTGLPSGASPLGWSHAWLIVVLQRLGRLVREVPDFIPTAEVA